MAMQNQVILNSRGGFNNNSNNKQNNINDEIIRKYVCWMFVFCVLIMIDDN